MNEEINKYFVPRTFIKRELRFQFLVGLLIGLLIGIAVTAGLFVF